MEESFALKKYGGYSLEEQSVMTAEERSWVIKRLDKEMKDTEEAGKSSTHLPSMPHLPKPTIPASRIPKR